MKNHEVIQRITVLGILAALIVVLAFIPVSYFFEITVTIVPLAVGILVGGRKNGLILGLVFGLISYLQCFGYSPLGVSLMGINPFLTFLVCVPTRMLAGWLPGVIYELIERKKGPSKFNDILCCLLVPVLNTVFFTGMLVICFYNTSVIQGFVEILNAKNVLHFIVLFVGINGVIEALLGVVTGISMTRVVRTLRK